MDTEWVLTPQQMAHMVKYRNIIADAYEREDMAWLNHFANQDEFKTLFGDMSFDEAYDRYEETPEWIMFVSEDKPISQEGIEWAQRRLKGLGLID